MPSPTSNNAVCAAQVNGQWQVLSFCGISTGLTSDSIHLRTYRYDMDADEWTVLPDVPDTLGKIAAAASVVDGVAYVIGGYHVFDDPPFERSSDRVHRLDLSTGTWLADGAPLPVPIDDHVQAVWRDSLIYVITGWSNTTNVPDVWIYDPASDAWTNGTQVPNNSQYKVFGASGTIIGDTIYYYGGASAGLSFPAQDRVRIGVIDPQDPTQIDWRPTVQTGRTVYRPACFAFGDRPHWLGGSGISYNYDGLAYAGGAEVPPLMDLGVFDPSGWLGVAPVPVSVMDLRGIGDLGGGQFILAGGVGPGRQVSDRTWSIVPLVLGVPERPAGAVPSIHPVPASGAVTVQVPEELSGARATLLDMAGKACGSWRLEGGQTLLDLGDRAPGGYVLKLSLGTRVHMLGFWLVD